MTIILVDHNREGQAARLSQTLAADGWLDLVAVQLVTLQEVDLSADSGDRTIWRVAQAHGLLLLTDNRNMKGADSLEQTMREEGASTSLPVITVGSSERMEESAYRSACATRLVEIILDLEIYRGAPPVQPLIASDAYLRSQRGGNLPASPEVVGSNVGHQ